mmetsp:Transcript_72673/g.142270  ORF Transcript_72673/g.142270 Transcript_72673/m.142270 type:complete len:774 (-) Transcript_72673:146-2467(-)
MSTRKKGSYAEDTLPLNFKRKKPKLAKKKKEVHSSKEAATSGSGEGKEADSDGGEGKEAEEVDECYVTVTNYEEEAVLDDDVVETGKSPELSADDLATRAERRRAAKKAHRKRKYDDAIELKEFQGTSFPVPVTTKKARSLVIELGYTVASKNELLSHVMSKHEVEKRRFRTNYSRPSEFNLKCASDSDCEFNCTGSILRTQLHTEGTRFRVAAFSAHTCVADVTGDTFKPIDPKKPGSAAKKFPPHAMTAPALAPAVQGLVNEDPKVKPKALGTLLSQYILQKPTDAFVSKVKKCCSSSTATTKEENAGSIEGYAKLCVDAGNYVVVRKIDDAAMELVLEQRAAATHALALRNADEADRARLGPFDKNRIDRSMVTKGRIYLGGWSVASAPEQAMFNSGKTTKVVQLDACHTDDGGLLYRAFTADAAKHQVMLLENWDARNEADHPWLDFFTELKLLYPRMNHSDYTLLSDMQKGIRKAAELLMPDMKRFMCIKHMKENVAKAAGIKMVSVYEKAAYATNENQFSKAMTDATPKLKKYLTEAHTPDTWSKLHRKGDMGGKMASQGVEAMNGADRNTGVRSLPIGLPMIEGILENSQRRFLARRVESQTASDECVLPLVQKKLSKLLGDTSKRVQKVTFVDKAQTQARLKMVSEKGTITRVVDLGVLNAKPECECGVFALDKSLCGCMLYVAQKAGRSFCTLLDTSQKGSTFKAQYTDLPPFKVPGNEMVADLDTESCLQPPAAFATTAGRPSQKRIKSAMEIAMQNQKKSTK